MTEVRDKFVAALTRENVTGTLELPAGVAPLAAVLHMIPDRQRVQRGLATALGIEIAEDLRDRPASATFTEKIPIGFARQHRVLGLAAESGPMPVAVADVTGEEILEIVARHLGRAVRPVLAETEAILAAINTAYQQRTGQAQTLIETLERKDVLAEVAKLEGRDDLLDNASRAPVIKLVNLMLFEAVKEQASDVHVQPYEDRLVIRIRIDGVLLDSFSLPKALQEEIISRVKIMGRMNIAEKRLAQDGRATVQVGDRTIDLRIASLPTSFGERVVIRLLDKSARLYSLGELGMDGGTMRVFRELLAREHGIILVTGPTGGGKTTTLYAALQEINAKERNILTLEDPIEYGLEGISQTQVSDKKGMTFASGLRSVLRQDPDIIMVGEIRDRDTAVMAIQSALTGHLVFSTLHTNDAASAITRLLDLGIEPYLLSSSVIGVLAQRLVRRVCRSCGRQTADAVTELAKLDVTDVADTSGMRQGPGCATCRRSGYSGRLGIFELLTITPEIRAQIQHKSTASAIKSAALASGLRSLRDDGVAKILAGQTTAEEVLRVTSRSGG